MRTRRARCRDERSRLESERERADERAEDKAATRCDGEWETWEALQSATELRDIKANAQGKLDRSKEASGSKGKGKGLLGVRQAAPWPAKAPPACKKGLGQKGPAKGKGAQAIAGPQQPTLPPAVRQWLGQFLAAGGRGRCQFWNANMCQYGNQCSFQHCNLVDGSNRPAINTYAPGTPFYG